MNKVKKLIQLTLITIISALILQGFQCSSREMTTAKVAFKNGDYDKAMDFAQQELTKNPQSDEAYMLIADIYMMKGNLKKAAEFAVKADQIQNKDTKLAQRPKLLINKIWVDCYNSGIENFNRYFSTQNKKFLDSAINYFEIGKSVRPEMLDFYGFIGQAYELRGDTLSAISEYMEFINKSKNEIDWITSRGVYLQKPRRDMLTQFGKPKLTTGISGSSGDSLLTDFYEIDGKDVYFFFKDNKKDLNFSLVGWRVNPPTHWLPNEQSQWSTFNVGPIAALAQINYGRKKYEEALKHVKLLGVLEPSNTNANAFLVQIYQDLGKMDEAESYLLQLIKENPKNKIFYAQLGDLYQTTKQFDKSIEYYKKALEIDPNYDLAIRNIASSYKNRASIIQAKIKEELDAERKKEEADKKYKSTYKPDLESYFPDLRESAKYFEMALKTEQYKYDFQVYSDLVNIYFVMDDKAKMNNYIEKLEQIENYIPQNQKEYYYMELVKIFGYTKNVEKMKYYQNKLGK